MRPPSPAHPALERVVGRVAARRQRQPLVDPHLQHLAAAELLQEGGHLGLAPVAGHKRGLVEQEAVRAAIQTVGGRGAGEHMRGGGVAARLTWPRLPPKQQQQ